MLFKYKNKSRISRLEFSDKCDIPSELPEDIDHFSQYIQNTKSVKNMIDEIIVV